MLKLLKQPYPFENSLVKRSAVAFGVGLFVFLFLYIFKPFELGTYEGSQLLLTLGYGLVTTLIIAIFNLMMLFSFQNYFTESGWTLGREIIWTLIMIALIGITNTTYTMFCGISNFSLRSVLYFELYTISIGFFPVTLSILINYYRLKSGYENESSLINSKLNQTETNQNTAGTELSQNTPLSDNIIAIISENGKDVFNYNSDDIIFIKSADNYIEVYYVGENEKFSSQLIRATLKKCEALFQNHSQFFRCHKSYLINLNHVKKVSGNAQGYKLHVQHTDELIPVSRIHNETIKTKLEKVNKG